MNSIKLADDVLYFPGHANIVSFKLESSILISDPGRNINDAREIRSEIEDFFEGKITTHTMILPTIFPNIFLAVS